MNHPSSPFARNPEGLRSRRVGVCARLARGAQQKGRGGFSLLEIMLVLVLASLFMGEALPAGRELVDRMAVISAREEVVASLHRVRLEAVAGGGASLILSTVPPTVRVVAGPSRILVEERALEEGVALRLSRGRPRVELRFDAMGLGRISSQTMVFSRGGVERSLVVSSLGRITRR